MFGSIANERENCPRNSCSRVSAQPENDLLAFALSGILFLIIQSEFFVCVADTPQLIRIHDFHYRGSTRFISIAERARGEEKHLFQSRLSAARYANGWR